MEKEEAAAREGAACEGVLWLLCLSAVLRAKEGK